MAPVTCWSQFFSIILMQNFINVVSVCICCVTGSAQIEVLPTIHYIQCKKSVHLQDNF